MQVHAVFQRYAEGTGLRVGLAIGQTNFLEEQLSLVGSVALTGVSAERWRAILHMHWYFLEEKKNVLRVLQICIQKTTPRFPIRLSRSKHLVSDHVVGYLALEQNNHLEKSRISGVFIVLAFV